MAVEKDLRICVLSCYPRSSREHFDRSDVGHPHQMFLEFFGEYAPAARVEVCFLADLGARPPGAIEAYDGFVWTGSNQTIYDAADKSVARQIEFAKELYRRGGISWGSCWGVQMAAAAAGGEVKKNPKGREWGIARGITRTPAGKTSPLLAGKPERYDGFIMHLDEVAAVPAGFENLASNDHTKVQALLIKHGKGEFWATQYHPEYNLLEAARLAASRAEAIVKEGLAESVEAVLSLTHKMRALYAEPQNAALRGELDIGDDLLDSRLRQAELRNWTDRIAGVEPPAATSAARPPKGKMTCPACVEAPLARVKGPRGIELDRCDRCGGLWFDWGEAAAFTGRGVEFQKMLDEAFEGAPPADRTCPRCGEAMGRAAVGGKVEIDQCASCAGLWMDDAELEALLSLLPPKA